MLAYRRSAVNRRVLVTTKTGTTFAGVLVAQRGPLLILKGAELVNAQGKTPVDGEILLERANVDFVQVAPATVEG